MRFLMIDRLTELRPGAYARAVRAVTGGEDYFADHFPGNPIMPGVLIMEAMAQTGGALITVSSGFESFGMMTMIGNAKFRAPTRPGDTLDLHASVEAIDATTARMRTRALVADREVATADIVYVIRPLDEVVGSRYVDFWRDIVRGWAAALDTPQPVSP